MPGFLQELLIARAAGHLDWRIYGAEPNPNDPGYFLQQIQDLELTAEGQDRARGRMIERPAPVPGEDDGHELSDLVLKARRRNHHPRVRLRPASEVPR